MSTQTCPKLDDLRFSVLEYHIRNLQPHDDIPETFDVGFQKIGRLDPQWVWVIDNRGLIAGILVASPCHSAVMVWRVEIAPGPPASLLTRLLRVFLRDMRSRGVSVVLTAIDPAKPRQTQFRAILERIGGKSGGKLELVAARVPERFI